jgi:hypothetical protein
MEYLELQSLTNNNTGKMSSDPIKQEIFSTNMDEVIDKIKQIMDNSRMEISQVTP